MLRIIFALIIVIILAVMAMANKELVSISYVLGSTSPLPLYLVLIVTFFISAFVFTLILLPSWIRDKMEIRKLRRRLRDMEETRS
ncbi:MAG: LapA family protein [Nitrospirota bacterium]